MTESIVARVARTLFNRGINDAETRLAAVGLLTAWHEEPSIPNARELLHRFSEKLVASSSADGLDAAQGWLEDPGFSSAQWEGMDHALHLLNDAPKAPIDWTAEFSASIAFDRKGNFGFNLSMPIARAMIRVLDFPMSETCACIFPSSSTLAWSLSGDREVTLYAGDRNVAAITALLARAACRPLKVDRRNPFDGSFLPAHIVDETQTKFRPIDSFDHIVSLPYFGLRIRSGASKGMHFEALQIDRLASSAVKTFCSIIPDGLLFRESHHDTRFRQRLIEGHATTVMSLPNGMLTPASGIMTSLLMVARDQPGGAVRVIDGRTMKNPTTGKLQERLIVKHLEDFRALNPKDESKVANVNWDELSTANYSLLPERYIRSGSLAQIEEALRELKHVELGEIATVERSKAPVQIRGETEAPPLTAMEIAPGDIVDGRVTEPKRNLAFDQDQEAAVAKVTVEAGDILVSIKGNVGVVGIVGMDAELAKNMNAPWIVSQSLAILRLKARDTFGSSEVLNALLTAPWVREKLESMSGGSTVRTLPISAVRSLALPVPSPAEVERAQVELDQIDELREQIDDLARNQADARNSLWHQLWHIAPRIDED